MKKLLLLTSMALLFLSFNGKSQCVISSGPAGSPYKFQVGDGASVAQSFTAACNGYLNYFEFFCDGWNEGVNDTLFSNSFYVHEGDGISESAAYSQQFSQIIAVPGDVVRLYFNEPYAITSGEKYTFELISTMDVEGSGMSMYDGGTYYYDSTNWYTDMVFNISVVENIYDCYISSGPAASPYIFQVGDGASVAQSFTAECNGYLNYFEFFCDGWNEGVKDTLFSNSFYVHEGDGISESAAYSQQFSQIIAVPGESVRLYFNEPMQVIAGEKYTFELISTMDVEGSMSPMYDGGTYYYDSTNWYSDMVFNISVLETHTPAYDLSCTDHDLATSLGECFYTVLNTELDPSFTAHQASNTTLLNDYNNFATLEGVEIPTGTHTINWLIFDDEGNRETCSSEIVVSDQEDPVMVCSEDTTIETSGDYFVVDGTFLDPTGLSDNCSATENLVLVNDFNDAASLHEAQIPVGNTTITWTLTDEAGNIFECEVVLSITVGIEDDPLGVTGIYPNPTQTFVQIDFNQSINTGEWNIQVLDALGKNVIQGNTETNRSSVVLDVQGLENGIYFIRVANGKQVRAYKIIKN